MIHIPLNLTSKRLSRLIWYYEEGCHHLLNIGRFSLVVVSRHGFTLLDIDREDSYAALVGYEWDYFTNKIHIGYQTHSL